MKECDLSSFGDELTVAIFGASGGIGAAVTEIFDASPQVSLVYSFSRSPGLFRSEKQHHACFDLKDEVSIGKAADLVLTPVDIVFVTSGLLYEENGRSDIKPEKTWRAFDPQAASDVFKINAIGPMLIAKHFLPKLHPERKSVFAAISARVGSISDNQLGGWYSYRASKAALNQFIQTAAIELKRKRPKALCVGLHPGTVDTGLSRPFQGNVPKGKLFTPEKSATSMISVLNELDVAQSGRLFSFDGREIDP